MFNVSRRVSFSVAIALTVGWGIFFLLFLVSSNTLLETQLAQGDRVLARPPGVRISVQVDKRVYRGGDAVLIAVRNDSRLPIWITTADEACPSAWWMIEQLAADGETWSAVGLSKQECPTTGITRFTNHTLKTDTWMALVPGPQIGDIFVNAPSGTYRVSVPYLKGKTVTAESWRTQTLVQATSPQFSIQ